jgi:peptide/nickel transport system substrate-binding protein
MYSKRFTAVGIVLLLIATFATSFQTPVAANNTVLRISAYTEDPSSLNPLIGNGVADWQVFVLLYDRLATFSPPDLHLEPWLAQSWETSSDGLAWTLHLVQNAKWHDGTPITSDDVKFTVEYVKQKEISIWLDEVQDITDVQAPDPYTVVVKTTIPLSSFPTYVMARMPIIPKHIWEGIDKPKEYANDKPIGSGPFTLLEYKPGEYFRFGAFNDYWKGRPNVDEILAKIAVPMDVALMELKKGDLDFAAIDTPYVPDVESDPNLKVMLQKGIYYDHLLLNTKKYPFSLKEFRQALAYAIDKNDLVARVLQGYGDVVDAPGGVPGLAFWYNQDVTKYPYNPDKAKQMLDSLGFVDKNHDGVRETPNGTRLEFVLTNLAGYPPYVRMGDVLTEQLAKVGIKIVNTPVEWAAQSKAANERDFVMMVWGWTISPEPGQYLGQFDSNTNPNPYWSFGEWQNATFNSIYEAQKAEVDINKRKNLIFQLEEILAQELPVMPIWTMSVIEAYRIDTFTNYSPAAGGVSGIYNKVTWLTVKPFMAPATATTVTAIETTQTSPAVVEVVPAWAYALIAILVIAVIVLAVYARTRKR